MESAKDFIEYYFNGQLHLQGELEKMLSNRDAAIRKDCSDRAVAWAKKWVEFPMGNHGEGALRAAIMGDKHE